MSKQYYIKQFNLTEVGSMSKTVPFQTIQFSLQKRFHFKQFSLVRSLHVKTVLFRAVQFSINTQFEYQSSSVFQVI